MNGAKQLQFLEGGGEMGGLTRAKNWSQTAIGPPEIWPQSLRTTLSILLNSRFPMFLWWGPDLICFYNDAYRPSLGQNGKHPHILGARAEEAWPEIWHIIKPLIDQVLNGGNATWSEDQLIPIYRNGKIEDVYWTFSYSPVNDESGKVAGVLVTCTETTEKILSLRRLEESESKLRALSNSLEKQVEERTIELELSNKELKKSNKELQSFAYVSSHDLQEPLRKIQTFANLILERETATLSENGKDNFQRIQNAAKRMQTLIDDLLAYSRTSTTERIFEDIDLRHIVDEVMENMKEEINSRHAVVRVENMRSLPVIRFQMRQLMQNLISNSLKFSVEGRAPVIEIRGKFISSNEMNIAGANKGGDYYCITVSDNGIGFEQQYAEKIFKVFQRLHGKSEYSGTGIGLAIEENYRKP